MAAVFLGFEPVTGSSARPARLDAAAALRETLGRVQAGNPYLKAQVGKPAGEGWVFAAALTAEGSPLLDGMLRRIGAASGTERGDVMASFFFGSYGWLVACVAVGSFLRDRRVPSLAAEDVAVRFDDNGYAVEAALLSARLTVLADDPAAGPGVTVAADLDALRGALRRELETHLGPIVGAVRARAPLGRRALWLSVGDDIAWNVVEHGKEEPEAWARAEIAALVGATDAPWRGRSGMVEVEADGRKERFLARASCCLSYKLPAGEKCTTCPLLAAEERTRRLRLYLREQAGETAIAAIGAAT